jgi:hypothetical protein
MSIIEFLIKLLKDEGEQQKFQENPTGYLETAGLSDVCAADFKEAVPFVADGGHVKPAHADDDDDHEREHEPSVHPANGETEVEVAVKYLKYITKNYTYNDNDVTYDNSFKQSIWNEGELELEQHFDNDQTIASGDGSVAAGDDIKGTVTTGNHNTVVSGDENVVGDGNAVGEGNNVANGDGSAAGEDNNVANGDNSAAGKGAVAGTFGDGANVATTGGEVDDSEKTEVDVDIEDSFKTYDSHDDESVHIKDSYNEEESVTQKGFANVNDSKIDVDVEVPSVPA